MAFSINEGRFSLYPVHHSNLFRLLIICLPVLNSFQEIDQLILSSVDPFSFRSYLHLPCTGADRHRALYSTSQFRFVVYDDSGTLENNHIQAGVDRSSISWAFTTFFASNWQPLTWLSMMLDYKMYGMSAGGYHVTNVLIHLVNTLLLFLILGRMTGGLWKSGFVAALFAVHPLHVESVAWVMARKDVLSTMFWLLTMAAYRIMPTIHP